MDRHTIPAAVVDREETTKCVVVLKGECDPVRGYRIGIPSHGNGAVACRLLSSVGLASCWWQWLRSLARRILRASGSGWVQRASKATCRSFFLGAEYVGDAAKTLRQSHYEASLYVWRHVSLAKSMERARCFPVCSVGNTCSRFHSRGLSAI